jgi:peroxiredoxin
MSRLSLSGLRLPRFAAALVLAAGLGLSAPEAHAVGEMAPTFALRDIDGKEVKLESYKGSVVVLQFWATWCGPCQVEMPHLDAMYKELQGQGFTVLSISIDDARAASQVKPLVKKGGFTFPVLLDKDTSVVSKYNPSKTVPYAVLIDRSGKIASVHMGYNPGDEVALKAEIVNLLKAPRP